MTTAERIRNIRDAVREACRIRSTGEPLGETVNLTCGASIRGFVVYHERLPVGRRASSPHSHSLREEFIFVLAGTPKVWIDGETHSLASGDYFALPAAAGNMHYLFNDGLEEAEYIMVASQPDDDVVTYQKS